MGRTRKRKRNSKNEETSTSEREHPKEDTQLQCIRTDGNQDNVEKNKTQPSKTTEGEGDSSPTDQGDTGNEPGNVAARRPVSAKSRGLERKRFHEKKRREEFRLSLDDLFSTLRRHDEDFQREAEIRGSIETCQTTTSCVPEGGGAAFFNRTELVNQANFTIKRMVTEMEELQNAVGAMKNISPDFAMRISNLMPPRKRQRPCFFRGIGPCDDTALTQQNAPNPEAATTNPGQALTREDGGHPAVQTVPVALPQINPVSVSLVGGHQGVGCSNFAPPIVPQQTVLYPQQQFLPPQVTIQSQIPVMRNAPVLVNATGTPGLQGSAPQGLPTVNAAAPVGFALDPRFRNMQQCQFTPPLTTHPMNLQAGAVNWQPVQILIPVRQQQPLTIKVNHSVSSSTNTTPPNPEPAPSSNNT